MKFDIEQSLKIKCEGERKRLRTTVGGGDHPIKSKFEKVKKILIVCVHTRYEFSCTVIYLIKNTKINATQCILKCLQFVVEVFSMIILISSAFFRP